MLVSFFPLKYRVRASTSTLERVRVVSRVGNCTRKHGIRKLVARSWTTGSCTAPLVKSNVKNNCSANFSRRNGPQHPRLKRDRKKCRKKKATRPSRRTETTEHTHTDHAKQDRQTHFRAHEQDLATCVSNAWYEPFTGENLDNISYDVSETHAFGTGEKPVRGARAVGQVRTKRFDLKLHKKSAEPMCDFFFREENAVAASTHDQNRDPHFSILAAAALVSWCPDSRRYHARDHDTRVGTHSRNKKRLLEWWTEYVPHGEWCRHECKKLVDPILSWRSVRSGGCDTRLTWAVNYRASEGFNAVASDLSLQQRRMSAGERGQTTESTHVVASERLDTGWKHVVLSRATVHVCDVEGGIESADWWWSEGIGYDTLRPRPRSGHGSFRSSLMTITSGFLLVHLYHIWPGMSKNKFLGDKHTIKRDRNTEMYHDARRDRHQLTDITIASTSHRNVWGIKH